jgi:aspartyl-tRNA(Asn)/glutamyl-tRNA(Gln) amidotransferase subunit A
MHQYTLAQLSSLLQKREISSEELTTSYLARIDSYGKDLNCFITKLDESALTQAKKADEDIKANKATPLTGIPIAHKDIFCTDGIRTTCASKMLDNFIAPYDATIISNIKDSGMVTLGKTNMDEFAMGSSNENSFYGSVKNPWDKTKVPGGSSGGSAAAVAARLAPVATGTDTGGSIRQPAGFCGITGLKPTYGRVSRNGMIAFASSLDQGGPLAQSAEDAAMLLNVMAGYDKRDSTSAQKDVEDYTLNLNDSIDGLKIGLPKQYFDEQLDNDVASRIQTAIKELESAGAKIMEVDLPNTHLSIPAYYVIAPAECSSNLARFDGVRYGYRCENPKDLSDLYCRSRGEGFGPEVKRRIMIGTYVLSSGYYDAYYLQAQKIRRLIRDDFQKVLEEVDVILGPTSPTTAFTINARTSDPVSMYLSDIYTVSVNLAGLPGISLPAGFVDGLPVGLQIIGRHFSESRLLNIGHRFQQATDWHKMIPEEYQ